MRVWEFFKAARRNKGISQNVAIKIEKLFGA